MSHKYSIPKRKMPGKVYTKEEFYREYYPILLKMLVMKKRAIMDAEDIVHDVFVYLFDIWDKIKWESVENLLSIVFYQSVVRYYRQFAMDDNKTSGSTMIELLDSDLVKDPMEHMMLNDFRVTLQNALTTLSPTEQDIFFKFYIESKSVDEIRGKRHKGAIHNLLFRARAKVSDYFAKNYERN